MSFIFLVVFYSKLLLYNDLGGYNAESPVFTAYMNIHCERMRFYLRRLSAGMEK